MTKDEFFTHCVMAIGPPIPIPRCAAEDHIQQYWDQAALAGMSAIHPSYGEWLRWWWEKNHAADQP